MKLLYCTRGCTTHDTRFVRAFVDRGVSVSYLAFERGGVHHHEDVFPEGVTVFEWPARVAGFDAAWESPDVGQALRSIVESSRPDVVQAGPVTSVAPVVVSESSAPVVAVSWGSDLLAEARADSDARERARKVLLGARGFLCDNAAVMREAQQIALSLPPTLCIPWGLETFPAQEGIDRDAVRVSLAWENAFVVIASRAWQRGYLTASIVDAFERAAALRPELRLLLLGDGPDAPDVRAAIQRSPVRTSIVTPGMVTEQEVECYLAGADAYVTMVPSDGTSIGLLQAMRAGVPVVVPQNDGNSEWVQSGVSGMLTPVGDSEAVASALVSLARNPALGLSLAQRARVVALSASDWGRNADRLVEFFEGVVRDSRAGSR